MSHDKKLLELAAKAAKIDLGAWINVPAKQGFKLDDGALWNPFDSAEQAFDLAVKCNLTIDIDYNCVEVFGHKIDATRLMIGDEPKRKTVMRAIVFAAAETSKV